MQGATAGGMQIDQRASSVHASSRDFSERCWPGLTGICQRDTFRVPPQRRCGGGLIRNSPVPEWHQLVQPRASSAGNSFVDIHCHLLPGIDDGPTSMEDSLAMARMAVADGIQTIVATPHQLGAYAANTADRIRHLCDRVTQQLAAEQIPLTVLPGADVRIEPDLVARLRRGEVLGLTGAGPYVLLELPHELYMPLEHLLDELSAAGYRGVLSHPERNQGILSDCRMLPALIERGCVMQITAGSLCGSFGSEIQRFSEMLINRGWVHVISTDAHGTGKRRPVMSAAFERVVALAGVETARALCCRNPAEIVAGRPLPTQTTTRARNRRQGGWFSWLSRGQDRPCAEHR